MHRPLLAFGGAGGLREMKGSDHRLSVVSGALRGRELISPNSPLSHPMGSREKLALFNMVTPVFADAPAVLDLYAGSGALGIEALSRGAREAVFVEKSPKIARVITENLQNLGLTRAIVLHTSAQDFCQSSTYHGHFELILADPPYDHFNPAELDNISSLLAPDGFFALSSPASVDAPEIPGLTLQKTRTYAGARLSIYGAQKSTIFDWLATIIAGFMVER